LKSTHSTPHSMMVMKMTDKQWRYVEIDGKRYEFCDRSECNFYHNKDCLHPNNKSYCCIEPPFFDDEDTVYHDCPARIIENVKVCNRCGGEGLIQEIGNAGYGDCPDCNSTGKAPREKCPACKGRGTEVTPMGEEYGNCNQCHGTGWKQ